MKRENLPELSSYRQILEETPRSLLQDNFFDFCNAEKAEQHLFRVANHGGVEYMLAYRDWKLLFVQQQVEICRKEQQKLLPENVGATGDDEFDVFMSKVRKLRFDYRFSPLQAIKNHVREECEELERIAAQYQGVYHNVWMNYKIKSYREALAKHDWMYHATEDTKHYEQMESNEQTLFEYAYEQGDRFVELFEEAKKKGVM